MRWKKYSFLAHRKTIRIEGFEINRFISVCMRQHIRLKSIKYIDDTAIEVLIRAADLDRLRQAAGSRYRITVVSSRGYEPVLKYIWRRKTTIVGIGIFIFLIFYQSLFVAEIEVTGYESISEKDIRQTLADAGLYEGARIREDTSDVKNAVFSMSDNIAYISVKYEGRKAIVDIVEAKYKEIKKTRDTRPCNIVSDTDCYIDTVKVYNGERNIREGQYVKKGKVLISGTVHMESTAYGTPAEKIKEYYVHAAGEVTGIKPYEYIFYEEKQQYIKETTGKFIPYINIRFGDMMFYSENMTGSYKVSQRECLKTVKNRVIPLSIELGKINEIHLKKQKRSKKDLKKSAEAKIRAEIKENLPEDAQIINKSLKFSPEENIIVIYVQLEVRQKIGKEEEITASDTKLKQHSESNYN